QEREINIKPGEDEQRVDQAVEHLAGAALWSVETGQKICPPALQLRSDLAGQGEFDFRVAALAQHAEEATEAERRRVLHNLRISGVAQLPRLRVGVFDLAQTVDQFEVERVASRKNSTIGDPVAQAIGR